MNITIKESVLITGAAGFVGHFVSMRLLEMGYSVIGVDNLNDYYDVSLKKSRLEITLLQDRFSFVYGDISDKEFVFSVIEEHQPTYIIHLAAQAGVRYSLENPDTYIQSNIIGTYNIYEACRKYPVKHLLFASSSSVYGQNTKVPFAESDITDQPISLYAATKKSTELIGYTYSHLFNIPMTGLRFFTVYGPMGRPDMAYFNFVDKYFKGEEIAIYNDGDFENDLKRDFTYIDDIVEGIVRIMVKPPEGNDPFRVLNIGNHNPENLMDFITTLEDCLERSLGRKVEFKKRFEPIKPGDVPTTYASTEELCKVVDFKPATPLREGLQKFTDWYVQQRGM